MHTVTGVQHMFVSSTTNRSLIWLLNNVCIKNDVLSQIPRVFAKKNYAHNRIG